MSILGRPNAYALIGQAAYEPKIVLIDSLLIVRWYIFLLRDLRKNDGLVTLISLLLSQSAAAAKYTPIEFSGTFFSFNSYTRACI